MLDLNVKKKKSVNSSFGLNFSSHSATVLKNALTEDIWTAIIGITFPVFNFSSITLYLMSGGIVAIVDTVVTKGKRKIKSKFSLHF